MQAIFSKYEHSYLAILEKLVYSIDTSERNDRTCVGTQALFAQTLEHDWKDGFPLMTHRKFSYRPAVGEMTCFIKGFSDISEFDDRGCGWWNDNLEAFNTRNGTPDNTDLGPIYGALWRNFHGFDQLAWLMAEASINPHSRRLMVTAWDPSSQAKAVLPPCHYGFQIFIDGDQLDLLFNMRSVDWVLGCPADMTAYGFLQLAICRHLGKLPGKLRGNFGDTHIYNNHLAGADEILRELTPRQLPQIYGFDNNAPISIFEIENTDFGVQPVEMGPSIHFPMAV